MRSYLLSALFLVFILFSADLFAQTSHGTIKGVVLTADGKHASFANVGLLKLRKATMTDKHGFFQLQHLPDGVDTLIISATGSVLYKKVVDIRNGETINLDTIHLKDKVIDLQKVEIKSSASRSYKGSYSFFGNKTQTAIIDIPQSISTITKELIHDKMEFTLKDAIDEVSGVNQYSGFDEYTIRGFRAENARDINGLRGYNSTYTSSMLVNIERVEVIKGPTATLYGNCDPGGTINLVTKKPLDKTEGEVDIYQGSWDHYRATADVTGPLNKSKTLLYRFNAGYDNANSFRSQDHAKSYELAPSLSFIPNDKLQLNVDFSISHINTVLDRGQPGFEDDATLKSTPISLTLSQPGDYLHETDMATTATLSYKISKSLTFNSGYLNYITRQDVTEHGFNGYITNDSVNLYYSKWHYPTTTNTISNYFTYQFNTGRGKHLLLAGYDYVRSKDNLTQQYYELPDQFGEGNGIVGTFSLKNPQYVKRPAGTYQLSDFDSDAADVDDDVYHTQGVYVQDQFSIDRFKVLFSLREEFYKGDETDSGSAGGLKENIFLPRIGIVYTLVPNINLYATYNRGFDPFEATSSAQVFNDPFKPIKSSVIEGGVKGNFFDQKLFASVVAYQLTVQNVAVNANDPTDPDLFIQQGENRSRGIEAEAGGNILPNLSVMLSYAYCVAKVTKSDVPGQVGTIVENAPRNTSGSWIKYTFSKGAIKGLGLSVGHSQVGMRNTLDPNITLPGYTIFNTGIHYSYHHFLLAMNVNNVFDKTYWNSAYNGVNKWPGAPRNYMTNLGYRF